MLAFLYRLRGQHEETTDTLEARLAYWVFPLLVLTTMLADHLSLPKWLGIPCALLSWGGISMGHSFAQGDTDTQYAEMGLVSFTRLAAMLLPLQMASCYYQHPALTLYLVVVLMYYMSWAASWISYQPIFQSRKLTLFGYTWCAPGGSQWEEFLVGLSYDAVFWILFLWH